MNREQTTRPFAERAFEDFVAAMSLPMVVLGDRLGLYKAMAGAGPMTPAQLAARTGTAERYVTEWLAQQAAGRNAIVVHYDGAFHSDYSQGTVDRVRRRAPGARLAVISAIPVGDPSTATLADHAGRADFLVFTKRIPPRTPSR